MAIINVTLKNTFDDQRVAINTMAIQTGDLSLLQTTIKTDIVSALNEVQTRTDDIGTLSSLTTGDKSDAVAAINEVDSHADTNTANITINTNELVTVNGKIDARIPYAHDSYNDYGNAGSGLELDAAIYDMMRFSCDFATLTLTTSTIEIGRTFTLIMLNAASCTITWPGDIKWPSGAEPTWTSGWDVVTISRVGATAHFATLVGLNYA